MKLVYIAGPYSGIVLTPPAGPMVKRRFSVTQDIVGFRRCPRQYGAVHVHKYAPAHQTQLYFGTVLHQVLDRCHGHYHGVFDPKTKDGKPDHTHLSSKGAEVMAGLVADELRKVEPMLARLLAR